MSTYVNAQLCVNVRRRTVTVHHCTCKLYANYMQIICKYPNKMADDVAVVTLLQPMSVYLFPGITYTFITSLNTQPNKLEKLFRPLNLSIDDIGRHFICGKCICPLLVFSVLFFLPVMVNKRFSNVAQP